MADKLLLGKIPIAGISSATDISENWLQQYINEKCENTPKEINIVKKGRLTAECDEMWSFVQNKTNKQWSRLAIDKDSEDTVFSQNMGKPCRGYPEFCSPLQFRDCTGLAAITAYLTQN